MKLHLSDQWRERADEVLGLGKYRQSMMRLKATWWEIQSLLGAR